MNKKILSEIFERLESGKISKSKAICEILNKRLIEEYDFANIDYQREERVGFVIEHFSAELELSHQ